MKALGHTEDQVVMAYEREGLPDNRSLFAERQASLHGVSQRTVHRILERTYGRARARAEKERRFGAEATADLLAMKAQLGLATGHAREILSANGKDGLPSEGHLNRILRRDFHLNAKKIARMVSIHTGEVRADDRIQLKAKKSNQVWQLDFTVAEQYYIALSGAVEEYSPLTHGGNKAEKDRTKLWLYSIVDDHAGPVFAWFYPGLSSVYAVDFLIRAMIRKGRDLLADQTGAPAWLRTGCFTPGAGDDDLKWLNARSFPLHGVPEQILTDNDCILKGETTLFKQALKQRLGVEVIHHLPGHSNVKGKVEGIFHILKEFQKVTRAGAFTSLYAANAALMDYLLRHNNRCNRFANWLSGLDGAVRCPDRAELEERLFLKKVNVRIDAQVSFAWDGKRVYLPREERFRQLVGERVDVILPARSEAPDEVAVVLDGKEQWTPTAEPIVVDTGKEFHGLAKTAQTQLLEEAVKADLSGLRTTGIYHGMEAYRKEYEEPLGKSYRPETLRPAKGIPRGLTWAVRHFQTEGMFATPVTAEERAWLRSALYSSREEVPEGEIVDFARDVRRGKLDVGDRVAVFSLG